MAKNKIRWTCIVLLIVLVIAGTVSADPSMYFTKDYDGKNIRVEGISVIENNFYYMDYFATDEEMTGDTIIIKDGRGNVIHTEKNTDYFPLPFYESATTIEIYRQDNLIFSKTLSFCNNNKICEPCGGIGCAIMENSATCTDCGSGSSDLYCDLKEDGICDPDCDGIDMDCPGCTEEICHYDGPIGELDYCEDIGGQSCSTSEGCAGEVVDHSDTGYCCIGFCVDPTIDEEYAEQEPVEVEFTGGSEYIDGSEDLVTNPVELFNMNYNDSIPVEDEGSKILCSNVGKSVCGQFEECAGQRVDSDDEGDDCCIGDCIPIPEKQFRQEYREIFDEDYNPALEETIPQKGLAQYIPLPTMGNMSLWWLLLAALALFGIILLYNFERKKGSETAKRIEYECNYYRNYGYNDEQIKTILAQRGWAKKDIKKVMKR